MKSVSKKRAYVVYRDNCLKNIMKSEHKVVIDAVIMLKKDAVAYINRKNKSVKKFVPDITEKEFYKQTGGQEGTYKSYINYKKYEFILTHKVSKWYIKKTKLVK